MRNDGPEFEFQVRKIAREVWPRAGGLTVAPAAGKEHDGVFVTEDVVHVVEATIDRSKKKAESDIQKIILTRDWFIEKYPNRLVKGWMVTRDEPTVEQIKVAEATKGRFKFSRFVRFIPG